MKHLRYATHSVYEVSVHIVWVTKYRYPVLKGDIQLRVRDLIKQVCDSTDVKILKGVVGPDHVHIHVSYPPNLSVSELVRKIKGRSGRKLLMEFGELKRKYWGGHFWAIGFGCWSTGNVTQDMVNEYLKHHKDAPNDDGTFILE